MGLTLTYILSGVIVLLSFTVITFYIKYKRAIKKNESTIKKCEEQISLSNKEITATLVESAEKYNRQLQMESKGIHEQYKEKVEKIKNVVAQQYNKDFQKIKKEKEDTEEKISKLEKYIKSLEKYSRNRGEVITHKKLVDIKRNLIKNQSISQEDMIIMGNIFIPYTDKNEIKTRQIDHLILSQSGILIIETKFWKGKILHGISKKNDGGMPIIVNNMFPENAEDKEETIIIEPSKKNDDNIREFKITTYDNPVKQVRLTALRLNEYITQRLNISKGVGSLVYFAYPPDDKNFVKNYSLISSDKDKFATLICTESSDLSTNIVNFLTNSEKKYSIDELKKIEILLNEFNRIV